MQIQDYSKELTLLKQYNRALEKENESRNEERKILNLQIERLTKLEREWKSQRSTVEVKTIIIEQSKEYIELKSIYTDIKYKYDALIIEHESLKTKVKNSSQSTTLMAYYEKQANRLNEQVRTQQSKINSLENQISTYELEISSLKRKIESSNTSVTTTQQYRESLTKISELQSLLNYKNAEITKLTKSLSEKDDSVAWMKRQVTEYAEKVNLLSEELDKIEKSQKSQQIRFVETEETLYLRTQVQKFTAINSSLAGQVASLKNQNMQLGERIHDFERRIMILEQTNSNLEHQLRLAIQSKKSSSQLQVGTSQSQKGLKQAIYSLKEQLREVKQFNILMRRENEELSNQLLFEDSQNHSHCRHSCKTRKSPIRDHFRHDEKYYRSKMIPEKDNQSKHQHHNHTHNHQSQINYSTRPKSPSGWPQTPSEKYNELQKRIQMLQSQNQVLKKHLVYEI